MFDWITKLTHNEKADPYLHHGLSGLLITGQSGFVSGTHVASNLGWRQVNALSIGDKVLTFDHGMQRVVDIQRETMVVPEGVLPAAQTPVRVPEGALNNRSELWLMPDLGMLVESETVTDAQGDPYAVVPARALEGLRGIQRALPGDKLDVITIAFDRDEVIYVEGGMLCHCPKPRQILSDSDDLDDPLYRVLDLETAQDVVAQVIAENTDALTCDPEEIVSVAAQQQRVRHARPVLA